MSDGNSVDCPACGEFVAGGLVCEECGSALDGAKPAGVNEAAGSTSDLPTAAEAFDLPVTSAATTNTAAPKDEGFEDDCPHFRLEFNDARVCVQGWKTSFNFRLFPVSEESARCRLPKLEVRIHEEKPMVRNVWGNFAQSRPVDVDFNFAPQCLGYEISSDLELSYQFDGQAHVYAGSFKWDAVSPDTPPSKVVENLVVKIEAMEAGMAADQEQNINILKDFKGAENRSMLESMQEFKRLKPVWKRVALYDTSAGRAPVSEGLVDRITLLGPGEARLHLLGGKCFTMGRSKNRDCDILTFLFKVPGFPDFNLTSGNGVSRHQAHLVFRAGKWEFRDGGIDPKASLSGVKPSSFGTYLNGEKIAGSAPLRADSESQQITFGKSNVEEKNTFGFKVTVLNDPGNGKSSGVLLERIDRISEAFLCLSGKVDIGAIFPSIASGSLCFEKGGFKHRSAAGDVWLKPGGSFGCGWSCESYAQAGFQTNIRNQQVSDKP